MATAVSTTAPNVGPAYPSDEEILGLGSDTADDAMTLDLPPERFTSPNLPHNTPKGVEDGPVHRGAQSADDAVMNRRDNSPQREGSAATPAWIEEIRAAVPQASGQLAALWQRASAFEDFDRAFYGNDAPSRQQFVERLNTENPAALRAMFAAAEQVLGRLPMRDDATHSNTNLQQRQPARESGDNSRRDLANPARAGLESTSFSPAAYAGFERSTNDAVISELNRAIESTLNRALPNDVADGARRRIANDTLAEIHSALRADRQLSQRVADVMRSGRLDDSTRASVAQLISSRARGLVSTAARRVVGEWTNSVLATHRERNVRQQATQSRVDITGGGLPQLAPRRAVRPGDIDYRSTSDEEILGW
jgi:hypothetical protein